LPEDLALRAPKVMDLRYGENPHQPAALYGRAGQGIAGAQQLQGKELSYNNLVDLDAAWQLALEFADPPWPSSNTPIRAAAPSRRRWWRRGASARMRSGFGVRRRGWHQPDSGCRDRARDREAVCRGRGRAGLRAGSAGVLAAKKTCG